MLPRTRTSTGLSFSVPKHIKIPPSLKNIYKELHKDEDIEFLIPTHGDLENWAKQGVLLLNCALTVRQKSPLSHMKYWKNFTDCIIQYISENCTDVVFLLWGTFSKSKKKLINLENHHIMKHIILVHYLQIEEVGLGVSIFQKQIKYYIL